MDLLRTFAREAVAMFVSDARLVAGVIVWVLVVVVGLRAELLNPAIAALLLPVGVAALLVFDAIRAARGKALQRK